MNNDHLGNFQSLNSIWGKGLSLIYNRASEMKNFVYEAGLLDSLHLKTPVISVGNLTVGGTGKTPITQMLIDYYSEKMLKPAVVGRNYKALLLGTAQVDVTREFAAQYFGDEPTLLALRNPQVPIFVGPSKWQTAFFAEQKSNPNVILVDDGFQHRALHRDLDIVLIDATVPISEYEALPYGKARESLKNLHRAHYVFLTKVNLVADSQIEKVRGLIPSGIKTLDVAYRLQGRVEEAGAKALAFSGLARPESFKLSIQQDTLYDLIGFEAFPDHYAYTKEDIKKLIQKKDEIGAQVLLTTEKDWAKVKNLIDDVDCIRVLELQTYFLNSHEEFYASLDQITHQSN